MSVIASGEFDDFISSCIASGGTDRTHHGFCSGIDHSDHLDGRNIFTDKFRHLHLDLGSCTETQTTLCFPDHGVQNFLIVVSENHRSPGADIINIFFAVCIHYIWA